MKRTLLLVASLALATLSLPAASACCHLLGGEDQIGPCGYMWRGNLVFTGLAHQSVEEAHAGCTAGDTSVGVDYVPCSPYVVQWWTCVLP